MAASTDGCEKLPTDSVYRLRVRGELGEEWSAWFDGLALSVEDGTTLFTGSVKDQAALHSLLARIQDLGLPLLSVECMNDGYPTVISAGT